MTENGRWIEQTLQSDCDGLVEKLHGLVSNYNMINDKYGVGKDDHC